MLLIEQVTLYGSFELLYLAIKTVGSYLPTVISHFSNLELTTKQLILIFVLAFLYKPFIKITERLLEFKKLLEERL